MRGWKLSGAGSMTFDDLRVISRTASPRSVSPLGINRKIPSRPQYPLGEASACTE